MHSEGITDYTLRPLYCVAIRHLIIDRISPSGKQTCYGGGLSSSLILFVRLEGLGKEPRVNLSVLLEVLRMCVFEISLICVKKYNFLHFVSENCLPLW